MEDKNELLGFIILIVIFCIGGFFVGMFLENVSNDFNYEKIYENSKNQLISCENSKGHYVDQIMRCNARLINCEIENQFWRYSHNQTIMNHD